MWNQLQLAWANISQRKPTWGQFEAHTDLKIIEKQLFYLGFYHIFEKTLESFGKALGDPLGTSWGTFGDAWGGFGAALGSFGAALGSLGDALGALLGGSSDFLGGISQKDPRKTPQNPRLREARARTLRLIIF